jgi:Ca2+-binding RTX toxin-like protein
MKIKRRILNYNTTKFSTKKLFLLTNKQLDPSKKFFPYFSLLCIAASFFVMFIHIDLNQERHNVIARAWADDINGTQNPDNITGTINQDTIKGLKGNDTMDGKEAGDDISGGDGNDTIYGNEGRDWLRGGSGNDRIEGAKGNDMIFGDRGNDTLVGGPGNDTITGGANTDIFICGTATDTITDFNITQKDTTPENDCENIIGNTKINDSLSQQNYNPEIPSIQEKMNRNVNTTNDKKSPDEGLFFGLFK